MLSFLGINECEVNDGKGECDQKCIDTAKSFRCVCKHAGYEMNRDGRTCSNYIRINQFFIQ